MIRRTTEAEAWIAQNRPDFEGPRPVLDEEELDIPQQRRTRRERGRGDTIRPETENVRRKGIILETTQINEELCAFVSEVGPFMPKAMRVLSPERLAREYLDDSAMRSVVNMIARNEGIELPVLRPEDFRLR